MLLVAFLAHSETRVVQPAREGKITSRLILPKRRKDVTGDPPSPYPLPHLLRPRLANKGAVSTSQRRARLVMSESKTPSRSDSRTLRPPKTRRYIIKRIENVSSAQNQRSPRRCFDHLVGNECARVKEREKNRDILYHQPPQTRTSIQSRKQKKGTTIGECEGGRWTR